MPIVKFKYEIFINILFYISLHVFLALMLLWSLLLSFSSLPLLLPICFKYYHCRVLIILIIGSLNFRLHLLYGIFYCVMYVFISSWIPLHTCYAILVRKITLNNFYDIKVIYLTYIHNIDMNTQYEHVSQIYLPIFAIWYEKLSSDMVLILIFRTLRETTSWA